MSAERYALTNGANRVVNVIKWDAVANPGVDFGAGITARLAGNFNVEPGDTFDGVTLTKGPVNPQTPRNANRLTLIEKGKAALTANETFLALPSPTNLQTLAQVQLLTRQANALIRLVGDQLDSTSGT